MTNKLGTNRKAPNAGRGRPKGAINKVNAALKDMILGALGEAGGVAYLTKQAGENPVAFMGLVGRVLPLDSNVNHSGTVGVIRYPGLDD